MMRRRKMHPALIILFALFMCIAAILFKERIYLAIGDYLIIQQKLKPVDVIHIIAGDDYRTNYAIQLYKQGYAKHLFFTGGWCRFHGYYHGEHGRQLALKQGVPPEAIVVDDSEVISTYAELVRLKNWMDHRTSPIRSVILLSDPFHMRRARWAGQFVLGKGTEILMAPVPFDQIPFKRQWWMDKASQKYVKDEYIKFVFYVLRYQLSWGKFQEWLAGFDAY